MMLNPGHTRHAHYLPIAERRVTMASFSKGESC